MSASINEIVSQAIERVHRDHGVAITRLTVSWLSAETVDGVDQSIPLRFEIEAGLNRPSVGKEE